MLSQNSLQFYWCGVSPRLCLTCASPVPHLCLISASQVHRSQPSLSTPGSTATEAVLTANELEAHDFGPRVSDHSELTVRSETTSNGSQLKKTLFYAVRVKSKSPVVVANSVYELTSLSEYHSTVHETKPCFRALTCKILDYFDSVASKYKTILVFITSI